MDEFTFERLKAWQKARNLVKEVYLLIDKFPTSEKYGLSSQLGRSIVSVPSNLAEGCGRPSIKERVHFYEIAYGSLMEAYTQLTLAYDLGLINENKINELRPLFEEVARMISGLRKSLLMQINSQK